MFKDDIYSYQNERPKIFNEDSHKILFQVRDGIRYLSYKAGAFVGHKAFYNVNTPDTYFERAILDYFVEIHEIVEVSSQVDDSLNGIFVVPSRRY